MENKHIGLIGMIAAVIAAVIVWRWLGDDSDGRPAPQVIVLEVHKAPIADSVEALGTAKANESVDITSTVTETIQAIAFTDGQPVIKDNVIALLEQQEEQAQLAAARARLNENQRELNRLQTLLKNKATSKREYDERVTLLEVTRQEIKEIEARIEDRTLRAPFDGVLGVRRLSAGALMQPGDLLTTIDDVSQIKLDFTVPAIYLADLKAGLKIQATSDAFPDDLFEGHIETVNTRIDPVSRSVLVRAILPNPDHHLRPGLLMQVTLLQEERQELIVPEESVIQLQKKHFVMVVKPDNVVEQREITIGVRRPGLVTVKNGLFTGERVIVRGVDSARNGQTVVIQDVWKTIQDSQFTPPTESH